MSSADSITNQAAAPNLTRQRSGRVVSKDGTPIAYDQLGHGPPVILIDGALCSRALGPSLKLAPLLAAQFTVFSYDRRGRGESGGAAPYAMEREVEDLHALIDMAGGSASVVGHSSGAVLALNAAERGLPIAKLALYEAPLIVDRSRASTEDDWAQIEAALAAGRRDAAVKAFLKCVGAPGFAIALMRWLPVWTKLRAVAHTLAYDGALVREFQRGVPLPADVWGKVSVPALAIAGGKSPAWLQNGTRALAGVLARAEHRTLPGQTHNVSAKALAPVLRLFFGGPS